MRTALISIVGIYSYVRIKEEIKAIYNTNGPRITKDYKQADFDGRLSSVQDRENNNRKGAGNGK